MFLKTNSIKKRINKLKKIEDNYHNNVNGSKVVADYTSLFKENMNLNENYFFVESYAGRALSISIFKLVQDIISQRSKAKIFMSNTNFTDFKTFFSQKELEKIIFVKKNSLQYLRALVISKTILTDYYLPTYFMARKEQTVINTGEGFVGFWINDISQTEKIIQHTLLHSNRLLFDGIKPEIIMKRLRIEEIKEYSYKKYSYGEKREKEELSLIVLPRDSSFRLVSKLDEFVLKYLINDNFYIITHPEDIKHYQESKFKNSIRSFDVGVENIASLAEKVYSESDLILNKTIFSGANRFKINNTDVVTYDPGDENYSSDLSLSVFSENWQKMSLTKKNIVIYAGGFANNGVTASAINLSQNIDYSKYNLIFLDKLNYDLESSQNLAKVSQKSNVIFRSGQMNLEVSEQIIASQVQAGKGIVEVARKKYAELIFLRESKRIMGDVTIDSAVDFSGYVVFWTAVLGFSAANKKSIFQHNDLKAETEKVINGEFKHKYKLPRVFQLYKYYDSIISVGKKTLELNRINLKKYAAFDKFKYVPNSLNLEEIRSKADELGVTLVHHEAKYYALRVDEETMLVEKVRIPNPEEYTLVSIGRMSPEKDQKKLINAFSRASNFLPQTAKLFILGDGILRQELEHQIKNLGLENKIILTGQVQNPFYFLRHSNGFILTSNHEGQPMVLLECLALNVPIIATDIAGNRSVLGEVLPEALVDNNEEAIVEKIIAQFQSGVSETSKYDIANYNKIALEKFYDCVVRGESV